MDREQLSALAELLSYPSERTAPAAERVGASSFFRDAELPELEESYTATFDLQPACAPYIGHHLLGEETGRRGPFLAALMELYRDAGYATRGELPDHLAEVLGYLAVATPGPARDELVRDGVLPALRTMIDAFQERANPYREILVLVERTLRETAAREADRATEPAAQAATNALGSVAAASRRVAS